MSRLRDYKKAGRRDSLDLSRFRGFISGLLVGIALTSGAFMYLRASERARQEEPQRPEPRPAESADPATAAVEETEQYDFYEMLPKFEVVVPEKESDVKPVIPSAPIDQPGVYVLQAGSYRNQADAERVSAQLARQGLDAKVQRVAIDNDVWHRVRIGPISDLNEVNRVRRQLRAAEIDAIVIRVGND